MQRVLLVEDSPTQALEMSCLLEDAGFAVRVAGDGAEALGMIRAAPPDIVVTDLLMMGMDGLALVEAVRFDFPFIPVVLVTAFGSERIAASALRAGAASYVPKRNLAVDLVPTLREILSMTVSRADCEKALLCMEYQEARFVLSNDAAQVPPLVRHLEAFLAALGFCDPVGLIHVGVALHEALINAIEWGNLEIPPALRRTDQAAHRALVERRLQEAPYRDRRIRLTAQLSPGEARYTVQDEGPGFDLTACSDPSDATSMSGDRGRGLVLIRTFMDEVTQREGRNSIALMKRGRIGGGCG